MRPSNGDDESHDGTSSPWFGPITLRHHLPCLSNGQEMMLVRELDRKSMGAGYHGCACSLKRSRGSCAV